MPFQPPVAPPSYVAALPNSGVCLGCIHHADQHRLITLSSRKAKLQKLPNGRFEVLLESSPLAEPLQSAARMAPVHGLFATQVRHAPPAERSLLIMKALRLGSGVNLLIYSRSQSEGTLVLRLKDPQTGKLLYENTGKLNYTPQRRDLGKPGQRIVWRIRFHPAWPKVVDVELEADSRTEASGLELWVR